MLSLLCVKTCPSYWNYSLCLYVYRFVAINSILQNCYSLWSSFAAINSHKKKLIICYSKLYPPLKISLSHSGHMFFLWYEKELNYSHALLLSDVWDKVLKRNTYLLYKVKIPICLDRGISAFSLIRGKTPAYKWYSPATGNFCYIKWKITICLDIGNICIFSDKSENSCIKMV